MNGGCWRSNASRTPHWALVLFGAATVPLGFFLRNGLGLHYGVGRAGGHVSRRDAIVTFILLLAVNCHRSSCRQSIVLTPSAVSSRSRKGFSFRWLCSARSGE